MELERLEVDEPDKAWKLSREPRAIALQSLGSKLYFAFGPNKLLDLRLSYSDHKVYRTLPKLFVKIMKLTINQL